MCVCVCFCVFVSVSHGSSELSTLPRFPVVVMQALQALQALQAPWHMASRSWHGESIKGRYMGTEKREHKSNLAELNTCIFGGFHWISMDFNLPIFSWEAEIEKHMKLLRKLLRKSIHMSPLFHAFPSILESCWSWNSQTWLQICSNWPVGDYQLGKHHWSGPTYVHISICGWWKKLKPGFKNLHSDFTSFNVHPCFFLVCSSQCSPGFMGVSHRYGYNQVLLICYECQPLSYLAALRLTLIISAS